MGSIFEALKEFCKSQPQDSWEVISHPSDFALQPVRKVLLDYTPVQLLRMGWCNERGTGGTSKKVVIHAMCDRTGSILCNYKSKAKYGANLFAIDDEITCLKCKKAVEGKEVSLRSSMAYGWL